MIDFGWGALNLKYLCAQTKCRAKVKNDNKSRVSYDLKSVMVSFSAFVQFGPAERNHDEIYLV